MTRSIIALVLATACIAVAEDIEITSLQSSGTLTWQGCAVGTTGRVEWAAQLEAGTTQWHTFTNLPINTSTMAVDIPMAFRIVGTPSATWPTNAIAMSFDRDLALLTRGATVTASSEGTYLGHTQVAEYAIDGLGLSESQGNWSPNSIPAWLLINLPETRHIHELEMEFTQHTITIDIEASVNGTDYYPVMGSTEVNPEGFTELYDEYSDSNFPSSKHRFEFAPSFPARWIRINVTATDAPGSHIFKAVIVEVKAFAQ
jgi:hypothetical protein